MRALPDLLNIGLFQFIRIHPLWVGYNYVQGLKSHVLIKVSRASRHCN